MASPQVENGYVKIANELIDALVRYRLPGEQMQCFLFIIRKTYGYCKKEDKISLSQFCEATGINKPCVKRALNNLLSKKIIIIKKDNSFMHVYEINKDFETWEPLSKKITLSKKIKGVIKKDKNRYQKRSPQKKKENNTKENFELFYSAYPKRVGKDAAIKAWNKRNDIPEISTVLQAINDQIEWRVNANGEFRPEWKHPSTWITQGCWKDEVKSSKINRTVDLLEPRDE